MESREVRSARCGRGFAALKWALLAGLALGGCDESGADGNLGDAGGSADSGDSSGGSGGGDAGAAGDSSGGNGVVDRATLAASNDGVPCGQILDCYELCNAGELGQSCIDECFASGHADGQTLLLALSGCFDEHGCSNQFCMRNNCAAELDACEFHQPEGGVVCQAAGVFEYCDTTSGFCEDRTVTGVAWGVDESQATFWAGYDCGDNLNAAIITGNFGDLTTATLEESCAVYRCDPG